MGMQSNESCELADCLSRHAQIDKEETAWHRGQELNRARARSATAWSAAGRAPSSARVHRIAARIDGEFQLVAGALSSDPERAKASAAELGLDPARSYGSFAGDGQGRGQAAGRHRGGRHRHAEPHAFPAGQGLPRSRHPRHLRQAADLDPRRRQEARRAGREDRQGVRADPQLHRLSDDPAGARDGREGRSSATSASCRPNIRRTG